MTTWDETKRRSNIAKHGVDLALAKRVDLLTADIEEDTSEAYGEQRFRAVGRIGLGVYVYIYALTEDESEDRAISLRRATPRERRKYEQDE